VNVDKKTGLTPFYFLVVNNVTALNIIMKNPNTNITSRACLTGSLAPVVPTIQKVMIALPRKNDVHADCLNNLGLLSMCFNFDKDTQHTHGFQTYSGNIIFGGPIMLRRFTLSIWIGAQ
jgi:hypothetical protein